VSPRFTRYLIGEVVVVVANTVVLVDAVVDPVVDPGAAPRLVLDDVLQPAASATQLIATARWRRGVVALLAQRAAETLTRPSPSGSCAFRGSARAR
jgi:hypothetical protein